MDEKLRCIAYHEAAHAVMIWRLLGSTPHKISIKYAIGHEDIDGGYVLDPGAGQLELIESLFNCNIFGAETTAYNNLLVSLAGYVAEELRCGKRELCYGDIEDRLDYLDDEGLIKHNDLFKAEKIADILVEHTAGNNKQIPYLHDAVRACEKELLSRWDEVERLALLLLQSKELDQCSIIDFFEIKK